MNIEEKIFKDLKSALERKDNHEANQLRNIIHLISNHKVKIYPRVPGDFEISEMLSDNSEVPMAEKYIIHNTERELIKEFAEKIYSSIKGIYPLEEFIDKVKEVAVMKRNLELN